MPSGGRSSGAFGAGGLCSARLQLAPARTPLRHRAPSPSGWWESYPPRLRPAGFRQLEPADLTKRRGTAELTKAARNPSCCGRVALTPRPNAQRTVGSSDDVADNRQLRLEKVTNHREHRLGSLRIRRIWRQGSTGHGHQLGPLKHVRQTTVQQLVAQRLIHQIAESWGSDHPSRDRRLPGPARTSGVIGSLRAGRRGTSAKGGLRRRRLQRRRAQAAGAERRRTSVPPQTMCSAATPRVAFMHAPPRRARRSPAPGAPRTSRRRCAG